MVTIAPSANGGYDDQSWGNERWCQFDLYKHEGGGTSNPLWIFKNSGSNEVGSHLHLRDSSRTYLWDFFRWLRGDFEGSGVGPSLPWDIAAITSAQRKHTISA